MRGLLVWCRHFVYEGEVHGLVLGVVTPAAWSFRMRSLPPGGDGMCPVINPLEVIDPYTSGMIRGTGRVARERRQGVGVGEAVSRPSTRICNLPCLHLVAIRPTVSAGGLCSLKSPITTLESRGPSNGQAKRPGLYYKSVRRCTIYLNKCVFIMWSFIGLDTVLHTVSRDKPSYT